MSGGGDGDEKLARTQVELTRTRADLARSRADLAQSQADLAVANELAVNLREALQASREIGMVMGILIERHKLTAEQAFDQLRGASSRQNVKLRDVAREVLYTGELPPGGGAGRSS